MKTSVNLTVKCVKCSKDSQSTVTTLTLLNELNFSYKWQISSEHALLYQEKCNLCR